MAEPLRASGVELRTSELDRDTRRWTPVQPVIVLHVATPKGHLRDVLMSGDDALRVAHELLTALRQGLSVEANRKANSVQIGVPL